MEGTLKKLTFKVLGNSKPMTGLVKNPKATVGSLAAKIGARMGLAGTVEMLTEDSRVLRPDTPLSDLPDNETITLAPQLTPAV